VRPLTVDVTVRAERQIDAADRWWKENRETSDVIHDEIARAMGLVLVNPKMYALAENARRPGLRRLYLDRIDYHLHYRVDERRGQIRIVAFRHARRRPIRI
jgi:plasmid stabilization system protein ParE